jgi:hypothetical protein
MIKQSALSQLLYGAIYKLWSSTRSTRQLWVHDPAIAPQQLCALHNGSPPTKQGLAAASVVVALAGAALFNSAKARRAEAKTPPAGEFIEVDGVRLHYVDQGKGSSTIVLLHGNGAMLQDYVASGVLDLAFR